MTATPRPVCKVCHRPLEEGEQYLVRIDGPRTTAVHRSLCFPPARTGERKSVVRPAA
jgi:RNase P subunit RPR2